MPLIESPSTPTINEFDKDKLLVEVTNLLLSEFPFWKVIKGNHEEDGYDFLLLRSVSIQRMVRIQSLNPFEKEETQMMQEVLAISLIDPSAKIDVANFNSTQSWTKAHILIGDVSALRHRLRNEQY